VLARVVDEEGFVDYDALERDRAALDAYVAWLSTRKPTARNTARMQAHWINAYNALILWSVLEEGRPDAIADVPGLLPHPGSSLLFEREFDVGMGWMSLWELENEWLRHRTQDYRVHAVLNCATRSCPPLRAGLYEGETLDRELDEAMARWVADPDRGVRLDGDEAVFSEIFRHYARDFSAWTGEADLCSLTAGHASGDLRQGLLALAERGCPHRYMPWDGRLNVSSR
jgi:hypothetical protein